MNIEKQKLLLSYMISDDTVFTRTNNITDSSYFDPRYQRTVNFIKEYYDKYKTSPSVEQIQAETNIQVEPKELAVDEIKYATDEIELFCRYKALEQAVLIAPLLIKEESYGELEKNIKDAIAVGLNKDLGLDYFLNPEERLKKMLMNQTMVPTGWTELDLLLNGGLNRKEMTLFAANSGVGKSILMMNLARNLIEQNQNILYITLELSEDVVAKRFDSMVTGFSQNSIFEKISEVSDNVEFKAKTSGKLFIKRMPESVTCSNDIRAYLKEFEMMYGFIPDTIVVDYLDLLTSNNKISAENLFVKDKYVSEELRSIANDYDLIMVSASQLGRGALDTTDHHQGQIQGGISKVNTTDNLIYIIQTDAMKAAGEYLLKLTKTRSSGGVGKHILLRWDPISLRVTNPTEESKLNLIKNHNKNNTKKHKSGLSDLMNFDD